MFSRTATQFDFMMKAIMIVLFVFGLFVFFVDVTKAVSPYYVDDPVSCPQTYYSLWPGVNLYPQNICGVDLTPAPNGTPQPYYTNTLVKASSNASSASQLSGSFGGGYLINCFADVDSAAPYCDNNGAYWCNSDSSCLSQNRTTTCLLNKWASEGSAFSCGDCDSTHLDCNGDAGVCEITKNSSNYPTGANNHYGNTCNALDARCDTSYYDCNSSGVTVGDGCEAYRSGSCTISPGLTGTWSCAVDAGGSCTNGGSNYTCTCVPPISNFQTGIESIYSTTSPLLWGKQFGSGDLISFSNATSSNIFVVKNDASVFMSSTLATTTDKYFYRYDGDLYWGDEKLNTGGGVYTAGDGLNLAGYEFSVSTSSDFVWAGQHTFNTTTTFPLGVWGADGKVGINTTTLLYTMNVQMSSGDVGAYGLFSSNGNILTGFANYPEGGLDSGAMGLYYNTSSLFSPSILLRATNTSWIKNSLVVGGTDGLEMSEKLRVYGDINIVTGTVQFNSVSGTIDQVIKINALGFPEWVDTSSLGIVGLPSGSIGQILYYNGSNWIATNNIFVSSSGFVGIGTTSPNSLLTLSVTSTYTNAIDIRGNNGESIVTLSQGSNRSGNISVKNTNSTKIFLNSNGSSYFNGGNLAVGTTTPNVALTVDGEMLITETSTMHDVVPERDNEFSLGTAILRWLNGFFVKLFADEATIASSTLTNTIIGTSTITNAIITSSTITNLNATNATTTNLYTENLTVSNTVKSNLFCDASGSNCFDPSEFGWSIPQAQTMNTTTASYNGNFGGYGAANGKVSYEAANEICSSTVGAGFHICQTNEIIDIIRLYGTSTFVGKINGWIANGPPGYVTVSTNDCEGYTTSSALSYGAWWKYNDNNGGGSGKMISCNSSMPISCCK